VKKAPKIAIFCGDMFNLQNIDNLDFHFHSMKLLCRNAFFESLSVHG